MTGTGQAFVPDGFCDYASMRRSAYRNLFPAQAEDDELGQAWKEAMLRKKQEVQEARQKITEAALKAKSINIGRNRTTGRGVQKPGAKPIRATYVDLLSDEVDVASEILAPRFPPGNPHQFLALSRSGVQFLPDEMRAFAEGRQEIYFNALRHHLFEGRLRAHYGDPAHGVMPFPNRNIWLDDEESRNGLVSGAMRFSRSSSTHWPMLFSAQEVEALFPPLTSAPKREPSELAIDVAESFIRNNYPEFAAPDWNLPCTNDEARMAIGAKSGLSISTTTLQNAKRRIKQT